MARSKRSRGGAGASRRGSTRDAGTPVSLTAREHLRAIAGGLLVGLPLLWTMEVWDDGAVLGPGKILALLAIGFVVVIGFNALAGFRRDRTWVELLVDSVEAMGLSALVAALALAVLGRLDPALGPSTLAGRIAIETLPVAFGMSLAATVMGQADDDRGGPTSPAGLGPVGRLVPASAGGLYFALNIAPTDEVRLLGALASPVQLLVVVFAGLAIGLTIVFYADFRGGLAAASRAPAGPLDTPLGETVAAYAVALLVSLVLLWAVGSSDGATPYAVVAQTVMLGIVASFGTAAGRLIVGGGTPGDTRQASGA